MNTDKDTIKTASKLINQLYSTDKIIDDANKIAKENFVVSIHTNHLSLSLDSLKLSQSTKDTIVKLILQDNQEHRLAIEEQLKQL